MYFDIKIWHSKAVPWHSSFISNRPIRECCKECKNLKLILLSIRNGGGYFGACELKHMVKKLKTSLDCAILQVCVDDKANFLTPAGVIFIALYVYTALRAGVQPAARIWRE